MAADDRPVGGLLVVFAGLPNGYAARPFTLTERLLSEPHALMQYLVNLWIPRPLTASPFTDDFPVSQGLLSPPVTLVGVL